MTTLSQPVKLDDSVLVYFGFDQMGPEEAVPIPPSRFREEVIQVISGAFSVSITELDGSEAPSFLDFRSTLPWEISVFWLSLRKLSPQRLESLLALSNHFPPESDPSEAAGKNSRVLTAAE